MAWNVKELEKEKKEPAPVAGEAGAEPAKTTQLAFDVCDVNDDEAPYAVLPVIAPALAMLGIRRVYHHNISDHYYHRDSAFFFADAKFKEENVRRRKAMLRITIDDDHSAPSVCYDWRDLLRKALRMNFYDIAVYVKGRFDTYVVLAYDADNNVVIATDLLHTERCAELATKAFSALLKAVDMLPALKELNKKLS